MLTGQEMFQQLNQDLTKQLNVMKLGKVLGNWVRVIVGEADLGDKFAFYVANSSKSYE